jgi:hypothetical protein
MAFAFGRQNYDLLPIVPRSATREEVFAGIPTLPLSNALL